MQAGFSRMIAGARNANNIASTNVSLALFVVSTIFLASCVTSDLHSAEQGQKRTAKIAPELSALYDEHSAYLAAGGGGAFRPQNVLVRVVEDRVLIDAVASGDVKPLQSDLVNLGAKDAVVFGRMISCQLPIAAIPDLAKLSGLQFARAAGGVTR
jgi:hypothetical protein